MEIEAGFGIEARVWKRGYPSKQLHLASTDLALRMRNEVGASLIGRTGEHVVEDEPVLIAAGSKVAQDTVGTGVPLNGWLVVTTRRLVLASLQDPAITEIPIERARVTHDEDGYLTVAWSTAQKPKALTIAFMPKTKLHAEVIKLVPAIEAAAPVLDDDHPNSPDDPPPTSSTTDEAPRRFGRKPRS